MDRSTINKIVGWRLTSPTMAKDQLRSANPIVVNSLVMFTVCSIVTLFTNLANRAGERRPCGQLV